MTLDAIRNQATIASEIDFLRLIRKSILLLRKEQRIKKSNGVNGRLVHLPSSGEAIIVGDLHGNLDSLMRILFDSGFIEQLQKGENVYLILLGDYGDRGPASPEVYFVVLKLKTLFLDRVILMRGNHEGPNDLLPIPHDLPTQLELRYGEKGGEKVYTEMRKIFNYFFDAVLVDGKYVLIHGGIPSNASSIEDLAYAQDKHPKESHLEEMLWSDPEEGLMGVQSSPRGAGKLFGADITEKILNILNVKILIRGHECCQEGYKINHNGKVMTLFSTNRTPYSNKHGAYLKLDLSKNIENAEQLSQYVKQLARA